MAVIPGVSDGELIRTTWGDAVADELNTNTVKRTAAQTMAGPLSVASTIGSSAYVQAPRVLIDTATTSLGASDATRKDYVDAQDVAFYNSALGGWQAADTALSALKVGKTGDSMTGPLLVSQSAGDGINLQLYKSGAGYVNGAHYIAFYGASTATVAGAITLQSGSADIYPASDHRLKDELGPIDDPVGKLMALQPKHLRWKIDGVEFDGFIAHEVQEVVPFAVIGDKDAVNTDGSDNIQLLSESKLVAVLTAALQEAFTKIDDLTARLETLEAA